MEKAYHNVIIQILSCDSTMIKNMQNSSEFQGAVLLGFTLHIKL